MQLSTNITWLKILIGIPLVVLTAVASFASSASNVVASSQPQLASELFPLNARSIALIAFNISGAVDPKVGSYPLTENLAKQAIRLQPLNSTAFEALATYKFRKGDIDKARALMQFSNTLSRRRMATQVWLIEDFARRGNLIATYSHLDTAMRINIQAREILYPILELSLDDKRSADGFKRFLQPDNPWLLGFMAYAVRNGSKQEDLAKILIDTKAMPDTPQYRALQTELIDQLVSRRKYITAKDFFSSLEGAKLSTLTKVDISADTSDQYFIPMTWRLANRSDMSGEFTSIGERGQIDGIDIYLGFGRSGLVAEKMLYLEPGTFDFQYTLTATEGNRSARGLWSINCLKEEATEILSESGFKIANKTNAFRVRFTVKPECIAQELKLSFSAATEEFGTEMTLEEVSLDKVSNF